MNKILASIVLGFGTAVVVGLIAVFSGTIIWLIWPVAIPSAFPGLVSAEILSERLSWFASVCLSWLFGLLIKSSNTNTNKK